MSKICMFGISGSGKSCYLYAMAQVMNNGVKYGNTKVSIIACDTAQQTMLNNGYNTMAEGKWPPANNNTTEYRFCVRVQHNNRFEELIPSLILHDYAGGIWQNPTAQGAQQRADLLENFKQSSAILFIVDSDTLLKAIAATSPQDLDDSHRNKYVNIPLSSKLRAQQQIAIVENLLRTYKMNNRNVLPPVLMVITKGDMFANKDEVKYAYAYLREKLPSIFANGSGIDAALTTVALGDNLKNDESILSGQLDISIGHHIHIPMLFALYAYLDQVYDGCAPDEQELIDELLPVMRSMFKGKIVFYTNGQQAFAV